MRNLKFHYVRAENILCFGPEGVDIHFADYGQVVQIVGINLDMPAGDTPHASNGAGKSSLQELISIGLYGRTVKSPTKNKGGQIVNCLANKGTIEVQWDDFRVLRTFKKAKSGSVSCVLEMWQSADKIWDKTSYITKGTSSETQAEIEKKIGLSHHAFCNVVIFDDSSNYSFLEADAATKREIVENLLDLDQYREYHENCKDHVKEIKKLIDALTKEYTRLSAEADAAVVRTKTVKQQEVVWKQTKTDQIAQVESQISQKQLTLESSNVGEQLMIWNKAQERLQVIEKDIPSYETKKATVEKAINDVRERLNKFQQEKIEINEAISEIKMNAMSIKKDMEKNSELISSLQNHKEGTQCAHCYGIVNRENYGFILADALAQNENYIASIVQFDQQLKKELEKLSAKSAAITEQQANLTKAQSIETSINQTISGFRNEQSKLSKIVKPEANVVEQLLESEIVQLKKLLKDKKEEAEGQSPYKEIIEQAEVERIKKESDKLLKGVELEEAEAELPYFQYWMEAFGDNGIRKLVIDGIIPALNSRVAHWMDILCDGLIQVSFDNKLENTILRNNNEAVYSNLSKSEKHRANLAVSQAFAYVMVINSGVCPGVVFLDEVTGGGIDRAGIPGIYNMIYELAKERQTFVTTHHEALSDMLGGSEKITVKKQNDVTVMVK